MMAGVVVLRGSIELLVRRRLRRGGRADTARIVVMVVVVVGEGLGVAGS